MCPRAPRSPPPKTVVHGVWALGSQPLLRATGVSEALLVPVYVSGGPVLADCKRVSCWLSLSAAVPPMAYPVRVGISSFSVSDPRFCVAPSVQRLSLSFAVYAGCMLCVWQVAYSGLPMLPHEFYAFDGRVVQSRQELI